MKKTLVTLALVAVGIAAFAVEFDWKTNIALNRALNDNRAKQDPAVVVQAMEYADGVTARTDQEKISLIAIRRTARTQTAGTDRSWKANKEFVDAQLAAAQLTKPPTVPQYLGLLYLWHMEEWYRDMYAFMKTQTGYEKWSDAGHCAYMLGYYEEAYNLYTAAEVFPDRCVDIACSRLDAPGRALEAANRITKRIYDVNTVTRVLNTVTNRLAGNEAVSAADMKAFYLNVNRKYSAMLLKDKAAWEPVIAQIRTMLETY